MKTTPHTPGPWELCYDKGSTRDILSAKHGGICTVRRAGRHDDATYLANAHLIAAAPDLLAALRELVINQEEGWRSTKMQEDHIQKMPYLRAAREAIAKAEGRA